MDIISSYADKENLQAGRPVVKGSDIDRVKRNLSIMPLKPRNQLDNNNHPTTPLLLRKCVNSPVTELANTFTELAAHETVTHNTPKRRLSLTSSIGSPTPELNKMKSLSSSSSSSPTSSDIDSASKIFLRASRKVLEPKLGGVSAFRRYNSSPFGIRCSEASPQLNSSRGRIISPLAQSHSKPFFLGAEDNSDSGFGKDEEFKFIAPSIPPEKARAHNEQSPMKVSVCKSSDVIGSPDIFDSRAQDSIDSPLLAHRLCSQEDDVDDGFVDLDDLEKQSCSTDVPDSIANMLTGKLLTDTQASDDIRGHLFKSPSVPNKLNNPAGSFDIRRRGFCSKRPEPPRDNNTPVAANKKRRSVLSDGNMPPVPVKTDSSSQPAPTTTETHSHNLARLLRCKSMVEHSAAYELNKSDSDSSELTGDFTKTCCLPLVKGKHGDLRSISPETMARLLNKEFDDVVSDFKVIDCRYPYEFDGGHIKGAENVFTKEALYSKYLDASKIPRNSMGDKRSIIIFHCEFSSERAPRLSRFLRNHDRTLNKDHYPNLYYPEVYLLEGGYKAFYESHKDLCCPDTYKPMLHKDHSEDLKTFRAKSKSWAGPEKKGFRPGLSRRL